jgi:hypothetical protein
MNVTTILGWMVNLQQKSIVAQRSPVRRLFLAVEKAVIHPSFLLRNTNRAIRMSGTKVLPSFAFPSFGPIPPTLNCTAPDPPRGAPRGACCAFQPSEGFSFWQSVCLLSHFSTVTAVWMHIAHVASLHFGRRTFGHRLSGFAAGV